MSLDLTMFEGGASQAVRHFWQTRNRSPQNQQDRGVNDQGNRSAVTAGKNLDGFVNLIREIVLGNCARRVEIYHEGRTKLNLPGYFRPAKNWDMLVIERGRLLAVIELKSQVGSFGNNFNNRVEEALGNALDLNTAFREGAFGNSPKPFVGYVFVLEDCEASQTPVRFKSPHFPARSEFLNTSYATRYEMFCEKLVAEQIYDAAALVLTSTSDEQTGDFRSRSKMTSLRTLVASLAGHIAAATEM